MPCHRLQISLIIIAVWLLPGCHRVQAGSPIPSRVNNTWIEYPIAYEGIILISPDGWKSQGPRGRDWYGQEPAWSFDHMKIAYSGIPDIDQSASGGVYDVNAGIYVMNADESGPKRLTTQDDREPCWSPDGTRIAFTRNRDVPYGLYEVEKRQICALDLTTGKAAPLTDGKHSDWQPTWSADGKTIAFTSNRSGKDRIWLMDADGKNPRPLPGQPAGACGYPDWSQQGDVLLFQQFDDDDITGWADALYTIAPDGTKLRRIPVEGFTGKVALSPDGRKIVYLKGIAKHLAALFIAGIDGTGERQVAPRFGGFKRGNAPDW